MTRVRGPFRHMDGSKWAAAVPRGGGSSELSRQLQDYFRK